MKITDIMLFGEAIGGNTGGGGGEQSALLRKICEAYDIEVLDTDTAEDIEKKATSAIDCWELDTEDGVDVLGAYTIVSSSSNVTSGDTVYRGVARLKNGVNPHGIPLNALDGMGVDLSNAPNRLKFTPLMASFWNIDVSGDIATSPISRLILPEVYPANGQILTSIGYCPAKVYLSKHMYENRKYANIFMYSSSSRFKEEIVIAPKDMDAQWHLHKFTKMSAETIVGILENLADVTDRGTPYTLTLGSTNLAKITEEQKNIAYAKGWNLA